MEFSASYVHGLFTALSRPDVDGPSNPFTKGPNGEVILNFDSIRIETVSGWIRVVFCFRGQDIYIRESPQALQKGDAFTLGGLTGQMPVSIS